MNERVQIDVDAYPYRCGNCNKSVSSLTNGLCDDCHVQTIVRPIDPWRLSELLNLPPTTAEEFERIREGMYRLADGKRYTWEEKIDNLAALAKAVGRYLDAEEEMINPSIATDYYNDARGKLKDLYEEFCQWRHDERYVVDEIKLLLAQGQRKA